MVLYHMKSNKTTILLSAIAIIVFGLVACNSASTARGINIKSPAENKMTSEGAAVETTTPNQTDLTKMLRNASMKFRVKDVQQTTLKVEKMSRQHGGYVAQSIFNIEEAESLVKKKSTDSATEIKKLIPRNHLEVFVLNTQLDSFLDRLAPMVDYLEFRHLTALDQQIEKQTPNSTSFKDENHQANNMYVANNLAVNAKYARVVMDIYQTPIVKKWTIPNPDSFDVARGGFWEDFINSLQVGARGIGLAINFFVSLWPIWFIALLSYLLFKSKLGLRFRNNWKQLLKGKKAT